MSDLYVLASIPGQGKTTTAILLEKKMQSEGKRVACLQMNKDKRDIYQYLSEGCYHYTIPLEATQTKEAFNNWVPRGYDSYIIELTYSCWPMGAPYISLFRYINEIILFELRDNWKQHAENRVLKIWDNHYPGIPHPVDFNTIWEIVHDRTVQQVFTNTPGNYGPSVDQGRILHTSEEFAVEQIQPAMKLPTGNKNMISVGIFPAEYFDIFPEYRWFKMDYAGFMETLRKNEYDIAILGGCGAGKLKLRNFPDHNPIICYQPSIFLDVMPRKISKPLQTNLRTIYETIKTKKPGTALVQEGEPFSGYNNPYWVYRSYENPDVVWKNGNTIFCNGWILPQYLIRERYLEVS